MDYERGERGTLTFRRPIDGTDHTVVFRAEALKRGPTGVHGRVTIGLDTTKLTSDLFNVERERDRIHLAGVAFSGMNGVSKAYPRKVLEHDLMLFCDGLWPALVENAVAEYVPGDAEESEAPFLLEPYIVQGGGTILVAPPGSGKSYTGMLMSVAIDSGIDSLWSARNTRALYVNLERSAESMSRRLGLVNEAMGLERVRPLLMLNSRGHTLADLYDPLLRTVEREGVGFVVLDSLSRGGFGNMNENDVANEAMDSLNSLGVTWLAIAHPPREDAKRVFGSQMFDAAADVIVVGAKDDVTQRSSGLLGFGMKVIKANDTRTTDWEVLAYGFDRYGLRTVRDAARHEFPLIESEGADRSPEDAVYDILLAHGARSGKELASDMKKSESQISRLLAALRADKRIIEVRRVGREQYWGIADQSGRVE